MDYPVLTYPFKPNYRPGFVGDFLSREHVLPGGIKVDPATFVSADAVKVALTGAAAGGATSLAVTALLAPIPVGALLDFGARTAVTVTVGVAGAAKDATTVPVAALSAGIPNGTALDFGGAKFARLTAAAAAGATSLTVAALPTALVSGDVATYAAVSARTARVNTLAALGATSLAVDALPEPLLATDVAYYEAPIIVDNLPVFARRVAAGTLVGTTQAALEAGSASGLLWHKAVDSDDVVRIVAYDIFDVTYNNDCDVLRPRTLIKVNHLPGWANVSTALKTLVRSTYECTVGTPGQEVAIA